MWHCKTVSNPFRLHPIFTEHLDLLWWYSCGSKYELYGTFTGDNILSYDGPFEASKYKFFGPFISGINLSYDDEFETNDKNLLYLQYIMQHKMENIEHPKKAKMINKILYQKYQKYKDTTKDFTYQIKEHIIEKYLYKNKVNMIYLLCYNYYTITVPNNL